MAFVDPVAYRLPDQVVGDRVHLETVPGQQVAAAPAVRRIRQRRLHVEVVAPAGELQAVVAPRGSLLRQCLQRHVRPLAGKKSYGALHASDPCLEGISVDGEPAGAGGARRGAQRRPTPARGGLEHALDEAHAAESVPVVGEIVVQRIGLHAGDRGPDHPPRRPVDVRECLDESLRVPGREARGVRRGRAQPRTSPRQPLPGRVREEEVQPVRVLLPPRQSRTFAVHAQREPVFLAGGHLAGAVDSARAAREPDQHAGVVLHRATRHQAGEIGEERLDFESCHVVHQVFQMRPDVPDRRRWTRLRRILPPAGLLVTGRFEPRPEPPLGVFGHDLAHLPQPPRPHQVARFPDHGVARVVVRQGEGEPACAPPCGRGPPRRPRWWSSACRR